MMSTAIAVKSFVGRPLGVAALLFVCGAIVVVAPENMVLMTIDIFIWCLMAASLNLLISFGHMVSFGHAAYFGLGAYGFALAIVQFGVSPTAALALGPLLAMLGGAVYGALCVRLNTIYFAMLTLACAEITYSILFQWYDVTGGDTGITNAFPALLGLSIQCFGLICLAIVTAGLAALWWVLASPLGLAIRSVGENPRRAEALGYSPRLIQWIAFVIAATLAGVAGSLYAAFHGNTFPDYAGLGVTLQSLVMVVIGGLGTFIGPLLGAVLYRLLDGWLGQVLDQWQLVVGLVLGAVILFSPGGLAALYPWSDKGGRK